MKTVRATPDFGASYEDGRVFIWKKDSMGRRQGAAVTCRTNQFSEANLPKTITDPRLQVLLRQAFAPPATPSRPSTPNSPSTPQSPTAPARGTAEAGRPSWCQHDWRRHSGCKHDRCRRCWCRRSCQGRHS